MCVKCVIGVEIDLQCMHVLRFRERKLVKVSGETANLRKGDGNVHDIKTKRGRITVNINLKLKQK
jgi:hypothetical protein